MKPRLAPTSIPAPRRASAVLLALSIAAVVGAHARAADDGPFTLPTAPVRVQPDKKEPDKKDVPKAPEYKWPTEINGKDINAVLKDLEDPDPVNREVAARALPQFGPPAQKERVSKLLVKRMKSQFETDPGVRIAVFNAIGQIQFENKADNKDALDLLALIVDTNLPGSSTRLAAIQTIAMFGPKGEPAITKLTGVAMSDPSYETRRSIAYALGRIASNETTGPNMLALTKLADVLAKDVSVSVRLEALQSLMLLGPPWDGVKKEGMKLPPPIDAKSAAVIVKFMRARVGDPRTKPPTHGLEKDKQVEIWARLVLMRFDPREVNDENMDAFAHFLTGTDLGVKAQALQALAFLGEGAGKKVMDVVRVMEEKDLPLPLAVASIQTLAAMGAGAKPALPNLKKLLAEKKKPLDEKMQEIKKLEAAKKPIDPQLAGEAIGLDGLVKTLEAAIKYIDEAKPTSPAEKSDPKKSDPPKKP